MTNEVHSVPFDATEYLGTPGDVAEYLNAALEDGDECVLLAALMDVVKVSGGVAALARSTGLSREAIYQALSEDGNPRLSSLVAILHALELDLAVVPKTRVEPI